MEDGMITCPRCGNVVNPATTTICPWCGQSLPTEAPQTVGTAADAPLATADVASGAYAPSPTAPALPAASRQGHKSRIWIGLALAVLLVAAGASGAYVLAQGGRPSGRPNTAITGASATETSVPTDTPLPTATPRPTSTPRPTATPTPRPHLVTVFQDSLTSNRNSWYNDGANCFFQSDGYHIRNGYECYAPIASQSSVNISVQVKQIAGATVDYGVGFRSNGAQNASFSEYCMYITETGQWSVLKVSNMQLSTLIPKTTTSAIHQGLNRVNTLEIDASGSRFTFFINGVRVGSATDGSFSSGKIGLEVDPNSTGTGLEVVYTNFKVTKWV